MSEFTKQCVTMQYTEIVYMKDGEVIAREQLQDDQSYDAEDVEPMTDEEIEDWG